MAQVKFKRIEDSNDINNVPIVDGQLIYTKDGKQFIDYETERTSIVGIKETILWENEFPDEAFGEQQITLNSDDYDEIIWIYRPITTLDYVKSETSIKNWGTRLDGRYIAYDVLRAIVYVDDTTYEVKDIYNATNTQYQTAYNFLLVPLYAIGRKTNLFN